MKKIIYLSQIAVVALLFSSAAFADGHGGWGHHGGWGGHHGGWGGHHGGWGITVITAAITAGVERK